MGTTLKELITKLNTSQEKNLDAENPVIQFFYFKFFNLFSGGSNCKNFKFTLEFIAMD